MNEVEEYLRPCISGIPDDDIRLKVSEFIRDHRDDLEWLPTSITGRYHLKEPLLVHHMKRCYKIAEHFSRAYKLSELQESQLKAAAMLHDLGKAEIETDEYVEGWKKFNHAGGLGTFWKKPKTSGRWSSDGHPELSKAKLNEAEFDEETQQLVAVHMAHWFRDQEQPDYTQLLHVLIVAVDYLASRDDIDMPGVID